MRSLVFVKNGDFTISVGGMRVPAILHNTGLTVSAVLALSAGDYIEAYTMQTQGSPVGGVIENDWGSVCHFSITRLGN